MTQRFHILHLTDVHFGMRGTRELWPQARAVFFDDLEFLHGEAGDINLVALTGDIAYSGSREQYALADEFLLELMEWLDEHECRAYLVVVPGNHDLQRPNSSTDPAALALRQSWSDIKDAFWADQSHPSRRLVDTSFAGYRYWCAGVAGYLPPTIADGVLPGDFTASIELPDARLGILGLNSTYRQLTDKDTEGDLSISGFQIQAAAHDDLPRWAQKHDINILLTHQPLEWLDNYSHEDVKNLVLNEPNRFCLHLCGHLHVANLTGHRLGGPSQYFTVQSPSLFGLEHWGKTNETRTFGYSLVTLDLASDDWSVVVWPRGAYKQDGAWRLDVGRSGGVALPKGSPFSNPISLSQKRPRAPKALATSRKVSAPGPHFVNQLESGKFVLVMGEGIQRGSVTASGHAVASYDGLRDLLAEHAGVPNDPSADIDGLLKLAHRNNQQRVRDALVSLLTARSAGVVATTLADVPFKEIYNLTLTNALECAVLGGPHAKMFISHDMSVDYPFYRSPELRLYLNVHGTPGDPQIENLRVQGRTSAHALWRSRIDDVLASYPIIFVTDDVDAWDLWLFVTQRGSKPRGGEIRPRSYLVTPTLSDYRQVILPEYNVEWLAADVEEFANALRTELRPAVESGQHLHMVRGQKAALTADIQLVSRAREVATPGSRGFLLGHEPTWGDAIGQYVITRSAEEQLLETIDACVDKPIVVIGTAGSGKSTLLRRVSIALDARGEEVAWIDRSVTSSLSTLETSLSQLRPDVVVIDDVDIFGAAAEGLLSRLVTRLGIRTIAGLRSTRMAVIEDFSDREDFWLDRLTDRDVARLTAALRNANLLGKRINATDLDLHTLFDAAHKQLLVAMIELTTGIHFRDKIAHELSALDGDSQLAYGSIAVMHHIGERSTRDLLRAALGLQGGELHRSLTRLISQRLVLNLGEEHYAIRHRVIADQLIVQLREARVLATILGDLLRAAGAAHARDKAAQPGVRLYDRASTRLMIRLLSHQQMMKFGMSADEARGIYDCAASVLRGDFHYHLQRGAYELEADAGDLELAKVELEQAKAIAPEDYKVVTEWAYMILRVAHGDPHQTADALAALNELDDVIGQHGGRSTHTFVVLSREGRRWLDSGAADQQTVDRYAAIIAKRLRLAAKMHPQNAVIAAELREFTAWDSSRPRP
jgi:ABC-type cobalamin/Fe3+-siderophores transport system ATPase subunit